MPKRPRRSPLACPICATPRARTSLPLSVPLPIPTYWSPEEALAVFQIVDELRDIILAIYWQHLRNAASHENPPPPHPEAITDEDLPF
jgi:hypothetical protein